MEDQIAQALVASMSADETTRVNAETQLTQGGTQPGFGLALTRVALNQQTPYGTRQLAAVVLKKYIKEHWQEGEGRFFPPQTSDEEKAAIRELLPVGLSDPIGKIRTACGMAIATICTWDWPHNWPALTGLLIGALRDRLSEDAVTGALRCLAMIAGDLEETQVPETVPVLFPELLALVDAPDASPNVKRRALAVMHSVLMTLGMMSGARQRAVRDLMAPLLPGWIHAFQRFVDPSSPPAPRDAARCGLVLETLRCLTQVTQYFSKTAGEALLVPLGNAVALFHAMAPAYRSCFVETMNDDSDGERDSDGETLSLATVTSQTIELVMTLVEHPRLSATLAAALDDVVYQAIGYMCMTSAQEETWRDDPNQYVADEDDDVSTVRAMCGMLLDELCDRFEEAALKALASAAQRRLAESEAARAQGNSHWWKTREATMMAVGVVADVIVEADAAAKTGGSPMAFDANAFLASVLDRELAEGAANEHEYAGNAFLRGRALWVAAKLAPAAPASAATAVLRAAVGSLAPNAEAPLRVGACRALAQYVPAAAKAALAPLLGPMYQGLGGLLEAHERSRQANSAQTGNPPASSFPGDDDDDDSLHLVLEAMLVVVKADDEAAAAWSHALAPATLRLWSARVADPMLSATARDVLEALANVPACLPSLLEMAVPTLAGVARHPEAQPPMLVEGALDVLAVLLRPAPRGGEEARACHAACFGAVARLATTSDDVGVMQSAAECLRAFLRSGGEASLKWGADGAGNGDVLRAYLDAAARLLSPETEEGACVFAAPLLGQMIRRLPNQMAPVLTEVVTAVVRRARDAQQPNLVAALVPVLARLVHADADALVAMLASSPAPPLALKSEGDDGIPPAATALEAAMRCWVGAQGDVQGAFDIKITVAALATLLASERSAPALAAVAVRGKPVVADAGDAPRTRARARAAGPERFHPTPAPEAMLALLADAVLEMREAAALAGDDDDEWEDDDDDEDDDDGGFSFGGGGGGKSGVFGGDLLERLMEKGIDDAEDDDLDELEDPLAAIDIEGFVAGALRSAHAAGRLAPLAANLDRRRQQALMTLLA
jgi:hypothetical protein